MSERLIVEFYGSINCATPVATVLAYHGGQEPETAAYTLASFFGQLHHLKEPRFGDAGILAARFISWLGAEGRNSDCPFDFDDVELIDRSGNYKDYLIARVFANDSGPQVKFLDDSRNSAEEFTSAEMILNSYSYGRIGSG